MQHAASHTTTVQPSSHNQRHVLIGKQWYQLPELIPANSNSGLHICISISILTQQMGTLYVVKSRIDLWRLTHVVRHFIETKIVCNRHKVKSQMHTSTTCATTCLNKKGPLHYIRRYRWHWVLPCDVFLIGHYCVLDLHEIIFVCAVLLTILIW